jgi:hypothetical protein
MAIVTGTTTTYTSIGQREDLEDVIWDLFAEDQYCLNKFDRVDADGVFHEWLLDTLAGATTNRQIEGDDVAYSTVTSPTRVGNYNQISYKTFMISGTLEAVKKAGRKKEAARQGMKKMRELKNDMEKSIVGIQASTSGGSATARSMGSMESWIPTTDNGGNGVRATTTSSASTAAYSSGVAAPTDGTTTGALTIAALNAALELAWLDGGKPTTILCDSTQKKVIDQFTGIVTRNVDVAKTAQATIINAAGVYVSSFGIHTVQMHRHVRSQTVLCIDPEYWSVAFLRRPFRKQLAETGDAEKYLILTEYTLVSRNHSANAKVVSCA